MKVNFKGLIVDLKYINTKVLNMPSSTDRIYNGGDYHYGYDTYTVVHKDIRKNVFFLDVYYSSCDMSEICTLCGSYGCNATHNEENFVYKK